MSGVGVWALRWSCGVARFLRWRYCSVIVDAPLGWLRGALFLASWTVRVVFSYAFSRE